MKRVVKNTYFSNWADNFGYPIAYFFVPLLAKIPFLTPNALTIISFVLFLIGSLLLFINITYHLPLAALCITLGYIGDDADGQLARYRNLTSSIGDYLDKTLDVLKIYIITLCLSYGVFLQTSNPFSLVLGFTTCFFFMFRYYIKLETMFSQITKNPRYLELSESKREELENTMYQKWQKQGKSLLGKLQIFLTQHRVIFWVDEAEFAVFVSVAAIFNKLEATLWILMVSQILISLWRFFERMQQVKVSSSRLLWPMRK